MNAQGNVTEENRNLFALNGRKFGRANDWPNRRNIDCHMMPRACGALAFALQAVAGMVVQRSKNRAHAHIERAHNSGYPAPFHSVDQAELRREKYCCKHNSDHSQSVQSAHTITS